MANCEIYALQSYNDGVREDLRQNKRATVENFDKDELDKYIKSKRRKV